MRKVEISERKYSKELNKTIKVEKGIGEFHEWGCVFEEFNEGVGNYTVAIRWDGSESRASKY